MTSQITREKSGKESEATPECSLARKRLQEPDCGVSRY